MIKDERSFGQRLRETRVRAGLSQSDLEEISGIPKARLSRYENGHVAPSIQTLERLAKALGVSEASLLGDQRAVLEDFFAVLAERGVQISTTEQAVKLAHAVAEMHLAFEGENATGFELVPTPALGAPSMAPSMAPAGGVVGPQLGIE